MTKKGIIFVAVVWGLIAPLAAQSSDTSSLFGSGTVHKLNYQQVQEALEALKQSGQRAARQGATIRANSRRIVPAPRVQKKSGKKPKSNQTKSSGKTGTTKTGNSGLYHNSGIPIGQRVNQRRSSGTETNTQTKPTYDPSDSSPG